MLVNHALFLKQPDVELHIQILMRWAPLPLWWYKNLKKKNLTCLCIRATNVGKYLLLVLPKFKTAIWGFVKCQIDGVLWWRGHVWTVSAWRGKGGALRFGWSSRNTCAISGANYTVVERTPQLNCATKHTLTNAFFFFIPLTSVLPSVPSPITHYSFQNTNSIRELLASKRNFVTTSFVAGGDFSPARTALMLCGIYAAGLCGSTHWLFVTWALCQWTPKLLIQMATSAAPPETMLLPWSKRGRGGARQQA